MIRQRAIEMRATADRPRRHGGRPVGILALVLLGAAPSAPAFLVGEVLYGEDAEVEPAFVPPPSILRGRAPGPAAESRLRLPILADATETASLGELLTQDWVLPGSPLLAGRSAPGPAAGATPAAAAEAMSLELLLGGADADLLSSLQRGLAGIAAVEGPSEPGVPRGGSPLRLPAVPADAGFGWPGLLDAVDGSNPAGLGLPGAPLSGPSLLPESLFPTGAVPEPGGAGLWRPPAPPR